MGQDGRAGRRGRRARPGAGAAARGRLDAGRPGRRVPAALPLGAGTGGGGTEPVLAIDVPDLARAGPARGRDRRRRRGRLPAAPGRRPRCLRPRGVLRLPRRPVAVRRVLPRGARGAAARRPPLDVLHVHDWHTGPALLERARGDAARDPFFAGIAVVVTLHNLAYHGWTGRAHRPARPPARRAARGRQPRRHRPPAARRSSGRRWRTRSRRVRPRVADAGVRDGPRRRAARQGQPLPRDPQRHRPRRLEPGRRPGARRPVLARRPGRQGRLPARPPRAQRLRPGDDRIVLGHDRAAGPPEGLRPARRRGAGAARRRRPGRSSRAAATRRSPTRSGRSRPRTRPASRLSSASTARWPVGSTRARTCSSCRRASSRAGRAR